MNGYDIEHNLVERRREWSFTAVEQALYHELGMMSNRSGTTQNFSVSNEELMFNLSISKPTLIRAREELIRSGLISYRKGELNGNKKVFGKYSINDLRLNNFTANVTAIDTAGVTLFKTKTKIKNINNNQNEIEKEFERFRIKYPGTKRGFETEFLNFKKKHPDYATAVFLLLPAVDEMINFRQIKTQRNDFVPPLPNMQTWINQRRWETEFENTNTQNNEQKTYTVPD